MRSPWSIRMVPGQSLVVTLTDYGWGTARGGSLCTPYAYIAERSVGVNQAVCGGDERERQVYTSTSDHVLIQIAPASTRTSEFLLRLTGESIHELRLAH